MNLFFTMKHKIFFLFTCLLVIPLWNMKTQATLVNPKPFVIPELRQWRGAQGEITISETTRIVVPRGNDSLQHVARMLAEDAALMWKFTPSVVEGRARKGDIVFSVKADKSLGAEGYEINISENIRIASPTCRGAYWGTRTLLQLVEQGMSLPKGQIRDWPMYQIRGVMLDCGRKYIPISYMNQLVKVMAYYKMNALHVHLNDSGFKVYFDDEWDKTYAAFRLESDTYPGLAARDGHYTKREFIDFQKEAELRYVDIIPEIDVPAHTLAFAQYRPSLGSKEYGPDHYDLFNPEIYTFTDALFKEYLEGEEPVFRGPHVHIGTDEYSNKNQRVVEEFRSFTDHYIKYVESFGKQAYVWGSLKHAAGTTPVKADGVVMYAWSKDYVDPVVSIRDGFKIISIPDSQLYIVPSAGYYYDYLNIERLYNSWTPLNINKVTLNQGEPALLGGMFAVWNDHVGNGITVKDIHHRLYPSLQTLAVKCWTADQTTLPFTEFNWKRALLSEAPGVNELAILSKSPATVFEKSSLLPGEKLPMEEIGYDYRISFDVEAAGEELGTVLFKSENATFYLSDPITGNMAYAREGKLCSYSYAWPKEGRHRIVIEGDNQGTRLFLDGKLVDRQHTTWKYAKPKSGKIADVRTLVFPLRQVGLIHSRIVNFKVEQL